MMIFSRLAVLLLGVVVLVKGEDGDQNAAGRKAIRPNPSKGHWIDAWATMPQLTEPANLPPAPFNQTGAVFVNSTIRQTLFMTATAKQIRLKFSNVFGGSNLPITAVTVALPINNTAGIHQIQPHTLQNVTFFGQSSISIPNGALAVSDPLNFPIHAQQVITVTLYLATGQLSNAITSHPGSRTTSYFQFGNAVHAPSINVNDPASQAAAHWYFLSSIEAWTPRHQTSLVLLGDSITDGRGSTTNANNRWPDQLLSRLQSSPSTSHIALSNLAAGGNRILADGLGPSAFSRIDRDILAHPNVAAVLVFIGVNDIGTTDPSPAAQSTLFPALTQAYAQIVALLHGHAIPVFAATITPFSAPANASSIQPYSHPERERTRQRVNAWIRNSAVFDGVVDFDAVVRDPRVPERLDARFDVGDYLHLSPRGYRELAERFPVELLIRRGGYEFGGFF